MSLPYITNTQIYSKIYMKSTSITDTQVNTITQKPLKHLQDTSMLEKLNLIQRETKAGFCNSPMLDSSLEHKRLVATHSFPGLTGISNEV